jgi:F-type H+-transporting ATPase subunit epsilon
MAKTFSLSVVAPDRSVVDEDVASVIAPGVEGYFGVQYGHAAMVAALKPGMVEYLDATGNRHFIYVGGGFAEVREDRVTVLADEAAKANEIDVADAERRLEEARKALRGEETSVTQENAVQEIELAMGRIKAARSVRQ